MKDTKPDDRSYLEQVAALELNGVAWTREKIVEVRDFLAPWNHNIALPHGVYTADGDVLYTHGPHPQLNGESFCPALVP